MAFTLKDGQKVAVAIEVRDAEGNPAATEGAPVWSSSDESLITVTPDEANPMAASVSTVEGPGLGTATVTVSVDADLGEGVVTLEGSEDFEVAAGDAVVINFVPGTPEPR